MSYEVHKAHRGTPEDQTKAVVYCPLKSVA